MWRRFLHRHVFPFLDRSPITAGVLLGYLWMTLALAWLTWCGVVRWGPAHRVRATPDPSVQLPHP